MGEEKGKRGGKMGLGTEGLWTRIADVGDWTVVIRASDLQLVLLSARGEKLCARGTKKSGYPLTV